MNGITLPVTFATYLALVLVLPTALAWIRTGTFPVTFHRGADPFQRLMGVSMGAMLAGLLAWTVLCSLLDPSSLSIWTAPSWAVFVGYTLIALGALLAIVSQARMGASWRIGIDDRRTTLVTSGIYRVVRNPIFTGMILSLTGVVLVPPSPWSIMGPVLAPPLIALQVRLEERYLVATHGDAYRNYAAGVGRFVPFVGRLDIN